MKCPKKIKHCQPCVLIKGKGDNFVCSGISTKPSIYKKDNIWLCSKGAESALNMEMTVEEALFICSALNASLGWLAPGVINANIKHKRTTRKVTKTNKKKL